jgi:hypothetical protein
VVSLKVVPKMQLTCASCGNTFAAKTPGQSRCRENCRRGRSVPGAVRFVGVDGEGSGSDPSKYVLLGVGDRQISDPDGLNWKQCFEFLYDCFKQSPKGTAFIGFYLGYDFTQMLKTMPEERVRMLLTTEGINKRKHRINGRQPHPVEYDGWQFDLLGLKRLRIRPKLCGCYVPSCKCAKAPWMFICDTGGFWQTSFLNVLSPGQWDSPVCTAEEYAEVERGKGDRDSAELGPEMAAYNRLENELLARAMDRLREGFEAIGVHLSPQQWFGPGQAAQKWMTNRLPKRGEWEETIPEWYLEAARKSYFGGWFEIFCHGYIERDVFEYDINSAYPATIRKLPCLLHGTYTRGTGGDCPDSDYCLVRCRAQSTGVGDSVWPAVGQGRRKKASPVFIGSMLHRNGKGGIARPRITEGWFWHNELQHCKRAGLVRDYEIYEWVNYEPCNCPPPLEDMEDLYQRRLEVGKDTVLGKACKLVYNSAYGKFAQSVGNPRFGNPVYASRITSECRTTIANCIGSHPRGKEAVVMVATDAVFFLEEHPRIEVDNALGGFDCTVRRGLTVFKPGVYWDEATREAIRKGELPKFKARGVSAKDFAGELAGIDSQFRQWDPEGDTNTFEWPSAKFKSSFSMVSCLQAIRRGKWDTAGRKAEANPAQSSDPYQKRDGLYWDRKWKVWRSEPPAARWSLELDDWDCVSHPYLKKFGFDEDPFSEQNKEAHGINDDGYVMELTSWVLKD